MDRLRREMDRLFAEWPVRAGWAAPEYPAMNVWTSENSAIVTAELPGVNTENIDISVEDELLTLRGNREPDELEEGMKFHRRERRYGAFARTFRLPFSIEANAVEATFKNGVLSITLPRAEAEKPKRIEVKSA
jgi:HSP20 family protein